MKARDYRNSLEDLPPHDEQAEWMTLCAAFEDTSHLPELDPDLFFVSEVRKALDGACRVFNVSDPVLRTFELRKYLEPSVYEQFLHKQNELPSAAGFSYWRDICREQRSERKRLTILNKLRKESDPFERTELAKELTQIETRTSDEVPLIGDWATEYVDEMERAFQQGGAISGLKTGFHRLDRYLNGLEPQRFYVIGARPNVGKSAMLAQCACNIAAAGSPVLLISLEMPATETYGRLTQMISGISSNAVRCGEIRRPTEYERFASATITVKKLGIRLDQQSRTLQEIVNRALRAVRVNKVKVMLLDYLQLVSLGQQTNAMSRYELVTRVSVAMKDLAMRCQIPVVAAAQLNRGSEKENRRPTLTDLRDSGAIEQDADVVMLLHRPRDKSGLMQNNAVLEIAKSRNGRCGFLEFQYEPELTRFRESVEQMEDQ